jgi:argininosuccinate lyase
MKVNRDRMLRATEAGFLNATDAADYLASRGVPFRQAHEVAGRAVAYCIEKGKILEGLGLDEWKALSPVFEKDIKEAVSIKRSLNTRKVYGGTALETVKKRLKAVKKEMSGGCC